MSQTFEKSRKLDLSTPDGWCTGHPKDKTRGRVVSSIRDEALQTQNGFMKTKQVIKKLNLQSMSRPAKKRLFDARTQASSIVVDLKNSGSGF